MACVAVYKYGLATVEIHDDYIEKDPVKHQEIIDRAFEFVELAMIRHALEDEKRQKALHDKAETGGTKEIDTRRSIKEKDREGICSVNEEILFRGINTGAYTPECRAIPQDVYEHGTMRRRGHFNS